MEARNPFELVCDENYDPYEILSHAEGIRKVTLEQATAKEIQETKNLKQESKNLVLTKGKKASGVADGGNDVPKKAVRESVKGSEPVHTLDSAKSGSKAGQAEKKDSWTEYAARKTTKVYRGRGAAVSRPRDGFNERGKREFDRQSGNPKSGVKPVEKRRGGGAHNWGRPNDNFEAPKEAPEEGGDEVQDTNESRAEGDAISAGLQELTLDEWKQKQKGSRSVPEHKLRRPGEGEDTSQWASLYALKRKDEDSSDSFEEAGRGRHRSHQKPSAKTVDVSFVDSTSRVKGTLRHSAPGKKNLPNAVRPSASQEGSDIPLAQNQEHAPKLDDFADFPSLSAT